jgi:hypothetical protein
MAVIANHNYFDFLETDEAVLPTQQHVITPHLPSKAPLTIHTPCVSFVIQLQAIERHLISLRQCLQMDNQDGLTHTLVNLDNYVDELIPILRDKLNTLISGYNGEKVENHLSDIGYPVTLVEGVRWLYVVQGQYLTIPTL